MKVFIISIFPISFLPPIITPFFGVVNRNIALQVILKFLTEVRHYFFIRFIYELSWYIMRYVEIIRVSRAILVVACKNHFLSPIVNFTVLIVKVHAMEILILSKCNTWKCHCWGN